MGLFSCLAFSSASSPHAYHWTGFSACCRRYGLDSFIRLFGNTISYKKITVFVLISLTERIMLPGFHIRFTKMKITSVFLIFAISALGIAISAGPVFAQQDNTCEPHTVCVHPGDMLTYNKTSEYISSPQTYIFEDMVNADNIKVVQSQNDNNGIHNNTLILNLKTGFVHSAQNTNATQLFLQILPSPINYDKSDTSIIQTITEFNGFKRTSIVVFRSSENSTSKTIYDIQTGILLEDHLSSIVTIGGNPVIAYFSDELASTNIINSDSDGIKRSDVSIPKWVKTPAKSWSQGDLQDSEFTNAIQYLISKGVMHVPHGASTSSSSQTIPTWLKHSTGMWADGQTTDDEFVQSIQWLISKGIVQVGN